MVTSRPPYKVSFHREKPGFVQYPTYSKVYESLSISRRIEMSLEVDVQGTIRGYLES